MSTTEVAQFIDELYAAVEADPAGAAQKVAELKAKVAALPPEQQQEIRGAVEQLKERAQSLPEDQKAQLGEIVATIRGESTTI
jgi:hypothetical protein